MTPPHTHTCIYTLGEQNSQERQRKNNTYQPSGRGRILSTTTCSTSVLPAVVGTPFVTISCRELQMASCWMRRSDPFFLNCKAIRPSSFFVVGRRL